MAQASLKAVKGGKTDEDPSVKHITIRGVAYTIREIDVTEYDKLIGELADANGAVRFDRLMRAMVSICVKPQPTSKPWPFPVYRTLEGIVNDMHYTDLKDEAALDSDESEDTEEGDAAPNS